MEHLNNGELGMLVFCGARMGNDAAIIKAAHDLGQALGEADERLIYGGGCYGLMVTVANSAIGHGGAVTGVLPEGLKEREPPLECLREPPHKLIITPDMHTRKREMFSRAKAIITLPGGDGTLDEFFEEKTGSTLGWGNRPHILANIEGYWEPLLNLMRHTRLKGFSSRDPNLHVVEKVDQILPKIYSIIGRPAKDNVVNLKQTG